MVRHFKLKVPKYPFRDAQNNHNLIMSRKKKMIHPVLMQPDHVKLILTNAKSCSDGAVG